MTGNSRKQEQNKTKLKYNETNRTKHNPGFDQPHRQVSVSVNRSDLETFHSMFQ